MSIEVTVMSLDFDSDEAPWTRIFKKNDLTVGRAPTNDIILDRSEVSAQHARIRIEEDEESDDLQLIITDLGSSNGTMVENTALEPYKDTPLSDAERIIIGAYLIKPSIVDGDSLEASPTKDRDISLEVEEEEEEEEEELEEHVKDFVEPVAAPRPVVELDRMEKHPRKDSQSMFTAKVEDQDLVSLDFEAIKLVSLSGKVLHHGRPLEGVSVDGGELGRKVSDKSGFFSFEDIAEDSDYSLSASKSSFRFECDRPAGTLVRDTQVTFTATELFNVCGRVTHKGKPLSGVEVDGGSLGRTVTDEDGRYCFENVPEGTEFTLNASKKGFKLTRSGVAKRS